MKIAMKGGEVTTGGETVFFRQAKTFFNPTIIAGTLKSDLSDADLDAKLTAFAKMQFERVGLNLRPEAFVIYDVNGDAGKFAAMAKAVVDKSDAAIVLMSDKVGMFKSRRRSCQGSETGSLRRHPPMPMPWVVWPKKWAWRS